MPHRLRDDAPGMRHHVYNRGIARRTTFETRRDVRRFLRLLACQARAGRIEILAYSFMTTHYHLAIRSCAGELSDVMQWTLNQYVRYFNRTRRRDGPLFRSRFQSKPVHSDQHFWTLIRYLDQNAPEARLAASAVTYPYGSAAWYVAHRRPPWLAATEVDDMMGAPAAELRATAYFETFGTPLRRSEARLIRRRLASRGASADEWDDLIDAAPERVRTWMQRKAQLADGTQPGLPYTDGVGVDRALARLRREQGALRIRARVHRRDAWPIVRIGMLHDLAGMTLAEIGRRCGVARSGVVRRLAQHRRLLLECEAYVDVVARAGAACLRK